MCKCKEERLVKKGKNYTIVACRHELLLTMEIEDENKCDSGEPQQRPNAS